MSAFFKNNRHGNSEESVSERNARYLIVLLLFVCFALLFSFVSRNNRFFSYAVDYIKAGDLVDQDITANATFDFVDRKRTEKNYDEIRQTTPRIYFTDDSKTFLVVADFSRIYSDSDPQNLRIRKILSDIYGRRYFELNDVFSDRSEYVVLDGQTLEKRDLLHSGTIDSYLRDNFGINETTKPSLSEIKMFIVPNVVYDYMATMQSISNLISNAPPVMVSYKRGDIIIARDEIVSEDQAELVREIRESENAVTAYGMIFKLSISFVMFFLAFYYIYELFKGNKLRRKQYYYFTCFAEFLYLVLTFLIYWMMSIRSNDFFYDSRNLIFLPSCLILFLTENKSVSLALMVLNLTLLAVFPFITLAVIAKSFAITSLVIILYSNGTRMPAVSDGSDFNMIGMTTEKAVESEAGQSDRENGTVKEGEGVFQHFKRFRFGDKWQRGRSAGRNGLAGVLLDGLRIDEYERRSTRRYYAKAFVALCVYMCFVALIDFSFYASKRMLAMDLIFEVAKLAVAFLFAFFVTRIFVDVFAMPTKDNLVRLLYENSSLLESFKAKCKGSFEHCMEVMDIAMLAADAIGCNSLLVGAAARYHDVGKMNHPEYFTENNPNESAHKYFSSKISAGLIKRHVKDGIDMIKASGLRMPLEALKIIEEHHGNDHISFFLLEAEREKGGTTKEKDFGFVDEDIFSYDLDRPSTKESAILMLADISEAGCRSLTEHTDEKHREFIHGLLMAKFDERQRTGRFKDQKGGQLENSTLTIGEFRIVEEAIVNKINAMYNTKRVSYKNTEKEQKKEQRINAN